jgi:hypothetical protein
MTQLGEFTHCSILPLAVTEDCNGDFTVAVAVYGVNFVNWHMLEEKVDAVFLNVSKCEVYVILRHLFHTESGK